MIAQPNNVLSLELTPAPVNPFERELTDISHIWACLLMVLPVVPVHMADEVMLTIDNCYDLRERLEARAHDDAA
jgi:hypothetical protein